VPNIPLSITFSVSLNYYFIFVFFFFKQSLIPPISSESKVAYGFVDLGFGFVGLLVIESMFYNFDFGLAL